jgi:cytochrome P450
MMKYDAWANPTEFESDPAQIEQLLRSSEFVIGPMDGYLQQIEDASGHDFSALRNFVRNALVFQAGPEHLLTRRAIAPFFSERAISQWSPTIAQAVAASLDRLHAASQPDLMRDFVNPLFMSVITSLVGFRDDGSGQLHAMIVQAQRVSEPMLSLRDLRAMNAAVIHLLGALPPPGEVPGGEPECLLSYLHGKDDTVPEGVDLRQTALALVMAANTTAQTLGFALYGLLMADRTYWEDAAHPDWMERSLDRVLSLYPSTLTLVRVASNDVEVGGCPYSKDQATPIDVVAANARLRAAAASPPARLRRSLSFGAGPHKCPGEYLARSLIGAAVPALARRFPKLALHKDLVRFRCTPMVQSPVSLPCERDGLSQRVSARLCEIKDVETARKIVNDDAGYSPPRMEQHLRALASGSGRDLSQAIRIARNAMFFMSGDRHAATRRAVAECLGTNRLPVWHDLIDKQVSLALKRLADSAAPDLIHDFATPLFRGITRPILGITTSDDVRFDTLAPILQDVLEPWLPMRELLRLQEVFDVLLTLMQVPESPESGAGVPLLSSMLASGLPDFDVEDVKALVLVLYGASFNLSHTLGNVLHWILIQPPEERQNVAEPRWIVDNLERIIALCASPKYIYRMVRRPVTLGEVGLTTRDTARLQLLSINRGLSTGNLAFGHGLHHCVGASLSRLMLRRAVPAIFRRFPTIALVPQAHTYFEMSQTVAMASVPCRLDTSALSDKGIR